jgi:hypothetical protein
MIDADMSLVRAKALATPSRATRLPRLLGLGLAGMISVGLWASLAFAVSHIL